MIDWMTLLEVVGVLGAAAVGLRVLLKAIKFIRKKANNMFGIGDLKHDIEALNESVQFIVSEFRPNDGKSNRDVLNRIELRQVLQEQRQKAILSDMSVGVFETDKEGEFVWVNRKYLRMTGRAPDEVKGSGWINTVAVRDRERVTQEWNSAIEEEREFESKFMLITPDDERVQVQARTYKMMIPETKEPLGFLGMLTPLCEAGRKL